VNRALKIYFLNKQITMSNNHAQKETNPRMKVNEVTTAFDKLSEFLCAAHGLSVYTPNHIVALNDIAGVTRDYTPEEKLVRLYLDMSRQIDAWAARELLVSEVDLEVRLSNAVVFKIKEEDGREMWLSKECMLYFINHQNHL
jgi:hypothetical protein